MHFLCFYIKWYINIYRIIKIFVLAPYSNSMANNSTSCKRKIKQLLSVRFQLACNNIFANRSGIYIFSSSIIAQIMFLYRLSIKKPAQNISLSFTFRIFLAPRHIK